MKITRASSFLFTAIVIAAAASACGDDGPSNPDGDIDPDSRPPGAACGGPDSVTCPDGQYCDFVANDCGRSMAMGECKPRPTDCPALLVPELTCGCDDTVYSSACEVHLAGADLNANGTCRVEQTQFSCGYRHCRLTNQYCRHVGSDVATESDEYGCYSLAVCGGSPACSCLAGEMCGAECSGDVDAGFTLTCRGG